jgi:hypothetical protein
MPAASAAGSRKERIARLLGLDVLTANADRALLNSDEVAFEDSDVKGYTQLKADLERAVARHDTKYWEETASEAELTAIETTVTKLKVFAASIDATYQAYLKQFEPSPDVKRYFPNDDKAKRLLDQLAAECDQSQEVDGKEFEVIDLASRAKHTKLTPAFKAMHDALFRILVNYKNGPTHRNEEAKLPLDDSDWRYIECYYLMGGIRLVADAKTDVSFVSAHYGTFYVLADNGDNPLPKHVRQEVAELSEAAHTGDWSRLSATYAAKAKRALKKDKNEVDAKDAAMVRDAKSGGLEQAADTKDAVAVAARDAKSGDVKLAGGFHAFPNFYAYVMAASRVVDDDDEEIEKIGNLYVVGIQLSLPMNQDPARRVLACLNKYSAHAWYRRRLEGALIQLGFTRDKRAYANKLVAELKRI